MTANTNSTPNSPGDAIASNGTVMMLCPHLKCRKILRVPQACRGKQVKCEYCGKTFQVPRDAKPADTTAQ